MKSNQKDKLIISSYNLYKLQEIINISLDLLDINYEISIEDEIMSYIDLKTSKKFIISDNSKFRKYDLRGIAGNNSRIKEKLNWSPIIKLDEICARMVNYEIQKYQHK